MRRLIPSLLLIFLLLFLLPIFQARPTTEVMILSVSLLGLGLFLGFGNQPHGLSILAGITLLISFVGVGFIGQGLTSGPNGAYCALMIWIVGLVGIGTLLWRRVTIVERGQIMVINQVPDNRLLVFNEGVHRPMTPFERLLAILPGYELTQQVQLKLLNTESLFNVDRIDVMMRYRIHSPRDIVACFPNRERSYEKLEKDRGTPQSTADQVAFWTELIHRQMHIELEEVVRSSVASIGGPMDVAKQRTEIARRVKGHLQEQVSRWGIEILEVRFLEVVVDPERIKMANRDKIIEREKQDAMRKADIHAHEVERVGEAQAKATARMVAEIAAALREQGATLSGEDMEKIIITAMQRMTDTQQLSGFFRQISSQQGGGGAQGGGAPPAAPGGPPPAGQPR